jgi:hypothetical protein
MQITFYIVLSFKFIVKNNILKYLNKNKYPHLEHE